MFYPPVSDWRWFQNQPQLRGIYFGRYDVIGCKYPTDTDKSCCIHIGCTRNILECIFRSIGKRGRHISRSINVDGICSPRKIFCGIISPVIVFDESVPVILNKVEFLFRFLQPNFRSVIVPPPFTTKLCDWTPPLLQWRDSQKWLCDCFRLHFSSHINQQQA